jgi:hypothetical protein
VVAHAHTVRGEVMGETGRASIHLREREPSLLAHQRLAIRDRVRDELEEIGEVVLRGRRDLVDAGTVVGDGDFGLFRREQP